MTLDDLLGLYVDQRAPSKATQRHYDFVIELFRKETGLDDTRRISVDPIRTWRGQVLARASPTTWNNYLVHLRALFAFGCEAGAIRENPFRQVARARSLSRRRKVVSAPLMERALTLLGDESAETLQPRWFWAIVVRTFYYTGMRRRQLAGLLWRDVDLRQGTVLLRAESSKNRREWIVPIPPRLADDLTVLKERSSRGGRLHDHQVFRIQLFYDRYRGDHLSEYQITGFFRRLGEALGEPITPHRLRHTMATELAAKGDVKALSDLLGHADVRTTLDAYVHPDVDSLRALQGGLRDI
ncbi:MAG: site-specific integrase [Chromatiales bacterium]|nr:site-specific integrase [Chromatiales bacterium]